MSSVPVQTALMKHLAGPLSEKKRSMSKGFSLGILAFGLFEFASIINQNIPRVPVPWVLAVTIWIAQIALFIRIASFLRHPRREDFFYIIALSSEQRNQLAQKALAAVHNAIMPFVLSSLVVIIPLEFFIIKEHSVINLLVVPGAVIAVTLLFFMTGMTLLKKNFIRPSAKDERRSGVSFLTKGVFSVFFSSMVVKISNAAGHFAQVKIRPFVIRNVMYLLRSDPLQFPLFTCAAPVLLSLFMLLIGDHNSTFMEFFTILSVFVLNFYYSAHLQEATTKLRECSYYEYNPKLILATHLFSIAIFSIPYVLIFLGAVNIHLISVSGALRLLTFLTALIATLFVSSRAVLHSQRKDSESVTDFLLFIITIAPGLFIPLFGWILPLLTIAAFVLLEWETISWRGEKSVESD